MRKFSLLEAEKSHQSNTISNAESKYILRQKLEKNITPKHQFIFPDQWTYRNLNITDNEDIVTKETRSDLSLIKFNEPLFEKLSVPVLNNQNKILVIPTIDESPVANWLDNDYSERELEEPTTGMIELNPKILSSYMDISKVWYKMTDANGQDLIVNDMFASLNRSVSKALFYGNGAAEPIGIANHEDCQTIDGSGFTLEEALDMISLSNIESDSEKKYFVMHPTTAKLLSSREKISGQPLTIVSEGKIDKYEVIVSHLINESDIFFGDFTSILLVVWGEDIDVLIDRFSQSTNGIIRIIFDKSVNFAHRNPKSLIRAENFS